MRHRAVVEAAPASSTAAAQLLLHARRLVLLLGAEEALARTADTAVRARKARLGRTECRARVRAHARRRGEKVGREGRRDGRRRVRRELGVRVERVRVRVERGGKEGAREAVLLMLMLVGEVEQVGALRLDGERRRLVREGRNGRGSRVRVRVEGGRDGEALGALLQVDECQSLGIMEGRLSLIHI